MMKLEGLSDRAALLPGSPSGPGDIGKGGARA